MKTRKMETFSNDVVAELNKAFLCTAARQQTKREKMWGLYHTIRTSLWVELLKDSTGIEPLPTFYQHVTDLIFKKHLLAHHFPLQDEHDDSDRRHEMQYVEANATRYVAGYVCCSLTLQE